MYMNNQALSSLIHSHCPKVLRLQIHELRAQYQKVVGSYLLTLLLAMYFEGCLRTIVRAYNVPSLDSFRLCPFSPSAELRLTVEIS